MIESPGGAVPVERVEFDAGAAILSGAGQVLQSERPMVLPLAGAPTTTRRARTAATNLALAALCVGCLVFLDGPAWLFWATAVLVVLLVFSAGVIWLACGAVNRHPMA